MFKMETFFYFQPIFWTKIQTFDWKFSFLLRRSNTVKGSLRSWVLRMLQHSRYVQTRPKQEAQFNLLMELKLLKHLTIRSSWKERVLRLELISVWPMYKENPPNTTHQLKVWLYCRPFSYSEVKGFERVLQDCLEILLWMCRQISPKAVADERYE